MTMKIYISLPMAGAQKTVKKRYGQAVEEVRKTWGDCEIYGPTNILDFDDDGLYPNAPVHSWAWHLGEDIKDLLECDAIYLTRGWSASKGCRTELAVAKANLIEVFKSNDADKMLDKSMFD